jgi:hypothetical protein
MFPGVALYIGFRNNKTLHIKDLPLKKVSYSKFSVSLQYLGTGIKEVLRREIQGLKVLPVYRS